MSIVETLHDLDCFNGYHLLHLTDFYDHSLPTTDSSKAVVSYWRNYGHLVLVNLFGSLPRNSMDG